MIAKHIFHIKFEGREAAKNVLFMAVPKRASHEGKKQLFSRRPLNIKRFLRFPEGRRRNIA